MDHYDPNAGYAIATFLIVLYIIVLAATLLFAAAYYVVMSIALSRLFAKVGIEPWIGWVPFYSMWKWLELGGQPGWLALLPLVPSAGIVTSVFLYVGMWRTGIAFRKDAAFLVLGIFLPFVWAFLLARPQETYDPELIVQAGYSRPLAGFGSAAA
ncbi:MAG: hypothetical protein BGO97_01000 [Micrococcales bacterium 70-64]|nr:hypothetical protein [Leifsonia sp.]ODU65798.1 MAG: hypothetical protein ABT06_01000 [Leifsonia sp. SCN 70-46]OJX84425.1 MAG: hypothetical protein BGO97_01000 [Micrococcales bacterium 70-64]